MKRYFSWLPNAITCLNLTSGCVALVLAFNGFYGYASLAICAAAVFDFLDGAVARLMGAYSDIGAELDSLSDLVSFGVAPGLMVYCQLPAPYNIVAVMIPVCGALRLARFNVDTRQTTSFIGLPIPANALFWIGMTAFWQGSVLMNEILVWTLCVVFISLAMLAPINLPSLKFHDFKFAGENRVRYLLIVLTIALLALFGVPGLALVIIVYLMLGAISAFIK
ncbi:MAG: CDP-diacylglycerol--serine O-phosphatidyltransferase [Bacteroidales bacterium]|nr:CDP-diacylglycerol--serine O-phosphatidyltransferase [Bacteroidales bacterium]MBD5293729.1 CDP-diacylglycerol--serine O-phosphatidyltransferase [Bacteroides sp.]MDE6033953.1 CDP-diacylglycerol--serine O-phosphatidyltransferase [Muribaculaceae bacterium]MBD5341636.1 CDP-diacylglycerol--serine O-phosphatidyltransferase [Bacteroides sp.]MBD5359705.1 CDP-diacylglycerol--serine O-phosphatidyltransferase [Bacteroides sp.]